VGKATSPPDFIMAAAFRINSVSGLSGLILKSTVFFIAANAHREICDWTFLKPEASVPDLLPQNDRDFREPLLFHQFTLRLLPTKPKYQRTA
jgi:hypothetical protein